MTRNLLIGGAAGQGVETTVAILEKMLRRAGYFVYVTRDFMSRVRGGHNFVLVRFGDEAITSHSNHLDGIAALNEQTILLHREELAQEGFILCDSAIAHDDPRVIHLEMVNTAKQLGNPRVAGSVALGALVKLFGLDLRDLDQVLPPFIIEEFIPINIKALQAGFESVKVHYQGQPGNFGGWMTLNGNQAVALGALAAGLQYYAAYPMSPSTSILEYLAANADSCGIVVEQAEDEIAAANMAIGAAYAGVRAMTGTSGGGFSLMVEALGLAGMGEIPVVFADIQRPGPATGLPTRTEQSDLQFVISASQGEFPRLVIALRDHQDAFWQTIRAFDIAWRYNMPVILLSDQYLADCTSTIPPIQLDAEALKRQYRAAAAQPPAPGETYLSYRITPDGITPRLRPGNPHHLVAVDSDEHEESGVITESAQTRTAMVDKRLRKLEKLRRELQEPAFFGDESCQHLLVGWGSMQGPLREAVELLNRPTPGRYGALVFGDLHPLPTQRLLQMAKTAKTIVNVEQNATGQLAALLRQQAGIACAHSILKYDGRQLTGEEIARRVKEEIQ